MLNYLWNLTTGQTDKTDKKPKNPLSQDDLRRQKISKENHEIVRKNPYLIDYNIETVDESYHIYVDRFIKKPIPKKTLISVTSYSTIDTAIYYYKKGYSSICVLNFADAKQMGGGYLNGRNAQEECLCRQTLLYPTLQHSSMYALYSHDNDLYKGDYMTYSPNVKVIRDNNDRLLPYSFNINVISAPAVDNRKFVKNANNIMERRIRKIIKLAAYKNNQVLVLGAFGCGVFKNDPNQISQIFQKVLVKENLKDYFQHVIFPIFKSDNCKNIFQKVLYTKH